MKLPFSCPKCFEALGQPSDEFMSVEIRHDARYVHTCSAGHTTITALQEQHFEVLTYVAGGAILDGYPREGIASMAAALERLYEYVVKVIGIELQVPPETFQAAWSPLSKHSERQFGAYVIAYALALKSVAPTIANAKPTLPGQSASETKTWTQFRNLVVHNGYFPSMTETMAYGGLVFNHMCDLVAIVKTHFSGAIQTATHQHLVRALDPPPVGAVSTMSIPTLVNLTRPSDGKNFEDSLTALNTWHSRRHSRSTGSV